jgi:hypothetical protein
MKRESQLSCFVEVPLFQEKYDKQLQCLQFHFPTKNGNNKL